MPKTTNNSPTTALITSPKTDFRLLIKESHSLEMTRAAKDVLQKLQLYLGLSQKQKMISQAAEAGTRLAPARGTKHDKLIGGRFDYGDKFKKGDKWFRRIKFQLNKDAENHTVKKLASENPHKIWAEADIQVDPAPEDLGEATDDVFDQMLESLDNKANASNTGKKK